MTAQSAAATGAQAEQTAENGLAYAVQRTKAAASQAERAVLIPVGATLVVRDNVVETVEPYVKSTASRQREINKLVRRVSTDLRRFERRGTTARNRVQRRVKRTRTQVERTVRRNRREAERQVKSTRRDVERQVKTTRREVQNQVQKVQDQVASLA